jgi:regulator of sirC expression with transglutaminase-like and TPR domain
MRSSSLADEIDAALESGSGGLTRAALLVSRVESPRVALAPAMAAIDALSARAEDRAARAGLSRRGRIAAINALLYDEAGFRGDRNHYDDVRNSLLTMVLERRLGIPVSLAVVYIAVARRAGLDVHGVSFPGHFLLRVDGDDEDTAIILDPFDAGRELDAADQRALLARHAGEDATLDARVLEPCANRAIVVRMLNNLKRLYVGARSFPQAWHVTDLLVALDNGQPEDVRDRGLLAYHLDDFPGALRDLERYLGTPGPMREETAERRQIWEHVSALRRRVAGLN